MAIKKSSIRKATPKNSTEKSTSTTKSTKKKVTKKKKSGAGPPVGNTNAEKWTEESATELFNKALCISADKDSGDNDFIGEVAQTAGTNLSIMEYLRNKYPNLLSVYDQIKRNCEANCFRNGKRGTITPSLAIMNLKSNHGWTDRNTVESNNVNYNSEPLTKEELDEARKAINDKI